MLALMERIVAAGPDVLSFLWFPVLIWTLLTVVVLAGLKLLLKIHVQYHYHVRLGLILALPAGLIMAGLTNIADSYILSAEQAAAPFKFIIVSPPIEISGSAPRDGALVVLASYWKHLFAWGMIAGSLVLFIRYLSHYLQLNRLSFSLPLFPLRYMEAVSEYNKKLASECGGDIQLGFLSRPVVPVTFGIRKPVILLPGRLSHSPRKMNIVLSHELTHILNRDYLIHMMVIGIKALFWYHPLVHKITRELDEYREMRCDNLVLADKSISPREYACVLLEMTPMTAAGTQPALNLSQTSSNLKQRIQRLSIDRFRHLPFRSAVTSFSAIFFMTAVMMAGTDMQSPEQPPNNEGTALAFETGVTDVNPDHQPALSGPDGISSDENSTEVPPPAPQRPVVPVNQPVNELIAISELPSIPSLPPLPAARINPDPVANLNRVTDESQSGEVHNIVEQMPELIGGLASIQQSIQYPELARRAGIEGRVMVQFIIDEEGKVINPEIIRGIGGGCDREALRAVQQARFRPGYQHGQPVRVQYMIPIYFRLQGAAS